MAKAKKAKLFSRYDAADPLKDEEDIAAFLDVVMEESGDDPERRISLDMAWHRTLLEECGNAQLLEMIATIKSRIWRYEYAYMQRAVLIPVSTRTHEQVAQAAAAGDVAAAAELLERNWKFGMEQVLDWMEGRP